MNQVFYAFLKELRLFKYQSHQGETLLTARGTPFIFEKLKEKNADWFI